MTHKNAVGKLEIDFGSNHDIYVGDVQLRSFLAEFAGENIAVIVKLLDDYAGDSDHEHDDRIL